MEQPNDDNNISQHPKVNDSIESGTSNCETTASLNDDDDEQSLVHDKSGHVIERIKVEDTFSNLNVDNNIVEPTARSVELLEESKSDGPATGLGSSQAVELVRDLALKSEALEAAQLQPTQTEPDQSKPNLVEPVHLETAQTESIQSLAYEIEPTKAEQVELEAAQIEPVHSAPMEDMEDGELSDDEPEGISSTDGATAESQGDMSLSTTSSNTDQQKAPIMSPPPVPAKRVRKSTESSDEPPFEKHHSKTKERDSSDSSSSSEEESRAERRRKKKEKERRKKERKQKRKREKQERKKRKRQRMNEEFDDGSPQLYSSHQDMYDDRWTDGGMRQRSGGGSSSDRRYDDYSGYGGERSPPGPYDSPTLDPYASPPDDSSDDEFSETLYSLVGDELMDPNVSAAEKEALFKKSQERIPGLSAGKLKKIMKKREFKELQLKQQRQRDRRRDRSDMPSREKTQKCRYYAEGKCQKGERCQFSHNFIPAKKMEACKFFLQGYCAKGDMCIYLHSEVPCKYYHTGQKCFNAEKCKFSHEPLTDSTKPLLEKAILLEETGTFKAERPSLLGSPPKEHMRNNEEAEQNMGANERVTSFDLNDNEDQDEFNTPPSTTHSTTHIPSILDLDLKPSAEMQQKLDAGLYEELTAPVSESDDDRFDSPTKRPKSFYSDTLASNDRPHHTLNSDGQRANLSNNSRKNRWGPDLPGRMPEEHHMNQPQDHDFQRGGGGDADRMPAKKGPLLPIPSNNAAPFSQAAVANNQTPAATPTTSTAQAAAANLSKILNALRSNVVTRNADLRTTVATDPRTVADPRTTSTADPRVRTTDPRSSALLPDPRSQLTDPRNSASTANLDSKPALLPAPTLLTSVHRPVAEINGKFTHPMEFKLIPVYVEIRTSYIPPGAENSQELLRDPRIKKRVLSMKKEGPPAVPSLPDITADLQRIQNARLMSNSAPIAPASRLSRSSIDSITSDPRVSSSENKYPYRGQGDQNSNNESVIDNGSKPRNSTRTMLSKVNPVSTGASYNNTNNSNMLSQGATYDDDDEEEDNTLTIDMPDDESKTNRTVEAAYT